MIIIYPNDPTTTFLKEIVDSITNILISEVNNAMPNQYNETIDFIASKQKHETILFLGHGYSGGLYGGCYVAEGKQVLINKETAERVFNGKKIILFACRTTEFILSTEETFHVALGFGSIKTDREDLTSRKEKKKYRDITSLKIFKENLIILFSNAISKSIKLDFTFIQFYNELKLRINKKICEYSLSQEPNERLAGELMFEMKREMVLTGNKNAKLLE